MKPTADMVFSAGIAPVLTNVSAAPVAASSGTLRLFSAAAGGRPSLTTQGDAGNALLLQPNLLRTNAALGAPINASTVFANFVGYSVAVLGTGTARSIAATNYFTRQRRVGNVCTASAGNFAGIRVTTGQISLGVPGTPSFGGFFWMLRFGVSDAATVSGARQFVGVASPGAPTNVEPSTLTNCIGVGNGAADTNLKIFSGGSAAQAPIDLGANFPANTLSTDWYELALYAPSTANNVCSYQVTRLNTGHVASGTITAATAGTQLPLNTTLLALMTAWRTNNASSLAVGLDFGTFYSEQDV